MKKIFDVGVVLQTDSEKMRTTSWMNFFKKSQLYKTYVADSTEDAILMALADFLNQQSVRDNKLGFIHVNLTDRLVNTSIPPYHCFDINGGPWDGYFIRVIIIGKQLI